MNNEFFIDVWLSPKVIKAFKCKEHNKLSLIYRKEDSERKEMVTPIGCYVNGEKVEYSTLKKEGIWTEKN